MLVKSPCLYPHGGGVGRALRDYAGKKGINYINYIGLSDEIGIDMSHDTYDGGLHLTLSGAEKLTRRFGKWVTENYGAFDHSGDTELEQIWAEKTAFYHMQAEDE